MNDIQVFDPDPKKCRFDEFAIDSDIVMWSARWLAEALGYADYSAFNKAIQKAIQVCVTLNIQYEENFRQVARKGDHHLAEGTQAAVGHAVIAGTRQ